MNREKLENVAVTERVQGVQWLFEGERGRDHHGMRDHRDHKSMR